MVIHSSERTGGQTLCSQDFALCPGDHSPRWVAWAAPTVYYTGKSETRPRSQELGQQAESPAERRKPNEGFLEMPGQWTEQEQKNNRLSYVTGCEPEFLKC